MRDVNLPERLRGLEKISKNLWWTWNSEAGDLFQIINPRHWEATRNPVSTLLKTRPERLQELADDKKFLVKLNAVEKKLNAYLTDKGTWFNKKFKNLKNKLVAYFSAEYGIHEALPIYSGGLGVLSGDHTKSASDLGIPMVFVGLFYKDGYFIQQIDKGGKQVDIYKTFDPKTLSLTRVNDSSGHELQIGVNLAGRKVYARVWEAKIGRVTLYLLDSNVERNGAKDRQLTARLYGGDREMRISQEVILGMGGIKLLEKLEIRPDVYHMNEGHSGFFQLERIKNVMKANPSYNFTKAALLCSSNTVFTTHTPVPAGNEAFSLPLVHKYFYDFVTKELKITWDRFLEIGMVDEGNDNKYFGLTVLSIRLSSFQNGVSELHGQVAKKMWRNLWPDVPEVDNPITYITNGVHVQTWTAPEVQGLFKKTLGRKWEDKIIDEVSWEKINDLDPEEIRQVRKGLKQKMIKLVRKQLKQQLKRNGESAAAIKEVDGYLRDDVLTIGFARRFATYKRATLLLRDLKRLSTIVNNKKFPVQFVFAGKAHPADIPGQKFIKEIYKASRKPEFRGKIIILENYDMNISRHMVAGVDVWLNNPRRPMEASGTSGQKVPLNIGINFSVLDGWWREGYNGKNGWTIGKEKDYAVEAIQDRDDADDFYSTLKQTIVPLFYKKSTKDGLEVSNAWITKAKTSLITNLSRFSAQRMVADYVQQLYVPALKYGEYFKAGVGHINKYLAASDKLSDKWAGIAYQSFSFGGNIKEIPSKYWDFHAAPAHHVGLKLDDTLPGRVFRGSEAEMDFSIYLGDIDPKDVKCEVVVVDTKADVIEDIIVLRSSKINAEGIVKYKGNFVSNDNRPRSLRVRILPCYKDVCTKFEFGLVAWL